MSGKRFGKVAAVAAAFASTALLATATPASAAAPQSDVVCGAWVSRDSVVASACVGRDDHVAVLSTRVKAISDGKFVATLFVVRNNKPEQVGYCAGRLEAGSGTTCTGANLHRDTKERDLYATIAFTSAKGTDLFQVTLD